MERYEGGKEIYKSPANGVTLYLAVDRQRGEQVILKYIQVPDLEAASILRKEGDNQMRLSEHPYICKVYDFISVTDYSTPQPTLYLVLVLEECLTDLEKLWTQQSLVMPRTFIDEGYLWRLLGECVEALAYAQDRVRNM